MKKKKNIVIYILIIFSLAQIGTITLFAASPSNSTPTISQVDKTLTSVQAGSLMVFTLEGFDFDSGDVLTFSANTLPSGASLNPDTGEFTWLTSIANVGSYDITFYVSDGIDLVSEIVTLTVLPVTVPNNPPFMIEVLTQNVYTGETLELTLTAIDPDRDKLTFGASILPQNSTLDPISGLFSWTPTIADIGDHFITFTVTDGVDTDMQTVQISVEELIILPLQ